LVGCLEFGGFGELRPTGNLFRYPTEPGNLGGGMMGSTEISYLLKTDALRNMSAGNYEKKGDLLSKQQLHTELSGPPGGGMIPQETTGGPANNVLTIGAIYGKCLANDMRSQLKTNTLCLMA